MSEPPWLKRFLMESAAWDAFKLWRSEQPEEVQEMDILEQAVRYHEWATRTPIEQTHEHMNARATKSTT